MAGLTIGKAAEAAGVGVDAGQRARAFVKLADVEAKIRRLQDIEQALRDLVSACLGRGPLEGCSIIEALERVERRDDRRTEKDSPSVSGPKCAL